MGKILFVTNIESNCVGFNGAIEGLRGAPGKGDIVVCRIEPTELWIKWRQRNYY